MLFDLEVSDKNSCPNYTRTRRLDLINKALIVNLITIQREDLFSATALWKLMGSNPNLRPKNYLALKSTQHFLETEYPTNNVSVGNIELSDKRAESGPFISDTVCKVFKGRNGGTYMEKKLLLDYAQWLSPAVKTLILETFIEYGQIAIEQDGDRKMKLLVDKAFDSAPINSLNHPAEETVEDKLERLRRVEAVATRKAFTAALEAASGLRMVDSQELRDFVARITDALYIAFLGDNTKNLRKGLGLGAHSTPRDAINTHYLYSISLTEQEIVTYLSQEGTDATESGVFDIIQELVELQRPLLNRIDTRKAVASHMRKRKGSGFTKGTYEAHRCGDRSLEYSMCKGENRRLDLFNT